MSKIKKLFKIPKKTVIASACCIAALAAIGTGAVFASAAVAERNSIGKTNAEQSALADAGIDTASASVYKTEFKREKGKYVYEVEFAANDVEYDYIINAADGAVIEKDTDGQMQNTTQQNTSGTDSATTTITAERAKEIALQHASLTAADVTFVHAELDYDDGVQVYDVEFYMGNTEYDYEIDAATGSVRSYDCDVEEYQPAATQAPADEPDNATSYIGVDRAKDIAVSHAGIALADVTFQKAKLENDDGRAEYEIEFYNDGIEYEYTIDAVSGKILEYDFERDD